MPYTANRQSHMDTFMGRTPALDAEGYIDDIAFKMNVVAKTAAFSVGLGESGTLYAVTGTGSITATLPAVASSDGHVYYFVNCADQEFIIASAEGDNIVMFNNAAADSISITTATEHIGAACMVVGDGTLWYYFNMNAGAAQTVTVVDA